MRPTQTTDVQFTELLREKGLTCIAANTPLEQLRQEHGVSRWYEFCDIIEIGPAPIFEECTQPFYVQANEPDLLPPENFYSDFDALGDGPANHALAVQRLSSLFGYPETTQYGTCLDHHWNFHPMSLSLRTFLKEKSMGSNQLFQRYPELWNKTKFTLTRNWTPPMSAAENSMLLQVPESGWLLVPQAYITDTPTGLGRGFFRKNTEVPGPDPAFWRLPSQSKLGWRTKTVSCILDSDWVESLCLERLLPARGSGGSTLSVDLIYPFNRKPGRTRLFVMSMGKPHDLDEPARRLAEFWGLPVTESESDDE